MTRESARADLGEELSFCFQPIRICVAGEIESAPSLGYKVGTHLNLFVRWIQVERSCRWRSRFLGGALFSPRRFFLFCRCHSSARSCFARLVRRSRVRRRFTSDSLVLLRHNQIPPKLRFTAGSWISSGFPVRAGLAFSETIPHLRPLPLGKGEENGMPGASLSVQSVPNHNNVRL